MKPPLRILHIEDSKDDSELIRGLLKHAGIPCTLERVETRPELFDALEKGPFDVILADCRLPKFSGLQALEVARALKPEIPFIFVSGTIGEEAAIESLRNGATDYILKDNLGRLPLAVQRAISESAERNLCRQLQQRLREVGKLDAVSTLSNGIAHDFNTLLATIKGYLSQLSVEYNHPQRVLEITQGIEAATQSASNIVQQLLTFARKDEIQLTPIQVNEQVERILEWVRATLPARVTLAFERGENLPEIEADVSQLKRAILNLTSNAIDSLTGPGRVTLSTRVVEARDFPESLPQLTDDRYLRLQVADTGAGMDAATREKIFEPFFTTKESGRQTGLGMSVVYSVMQAHHGMVDIESTPGKGTIVSLYFPVKIETKTRREPRPSQLVSAGA